MNEETTIDYDKGFCCSHCGSYLKRYTRSLNSNMCLALLALYKHKATGYVKVEDFLLKHGYSRCGDFSYLRHYGFLQAMDAKREDGSKRNGYYKLTNEGINFVTGNIKAYSKFKILNNKFEGFSGEEIDIRTAIGKKFNYEELMGGLDLVSVKRPSQYKKPKQEITTTNGKVITPQKLF